MSHINSVSNGLGGQSLELVLKAIRGEIPATVAITADTGWENDCLWSTGRRTDAKTYFDEVIVPLCKGSRVTPFFVRARDKNKNEMVSLLNHTQACVDTEKLGNLKIPVFGSQGGQYMQSCTQRWKIQAINQMLRRLGAKTACTAQGIHFGEADRRVKGIYLRDEGGFSIYQTTFKSKKVDVPIRWLTHYYPLVDLKLRREDVIEKIKKEGIPYLISSECDLCPHKDLARWERTSEDVIAQGEALETAFAGKFFFTDERIPLRQAIAKMKADRVAHPERYKREADFGCGNATCGV